MRKRTLPKPIEGFLTPLALLDAFKLNPLFQNCFTTSTGRVTRLTEKLGAFGFATLERVSQFLDIRPDTLHKQNRVRLLAKVRRIDGQLSLFFYNNEINS